MRHCVLHQYFLFVASALRLGMILQITKQSPASWRSMKLRDEAWSFMTKHDTSWRSMKLRYRRSCFVAEGNASSLKKMFHSWPGVVMMCGGVFNTKHDLQKRSIASLGEAMLRETKQCVARWNNASLDETMLRFYTSCKNEARDGFIICSIYA